MTAKHFAELFQSEAEKGTVLSIIPPNLDKVTGTNMSDTSKEVRGRKGKRGRGVLSAVDIRNLPHLLLATAIFVLWQKS